MVTARSIAILVSATLFSIALSLAVVMAAIEPAFSASFYKDSFARHNVYSRLRIALAQEQPDLQASVNEELIRSVLDAFVDNMFAYVRGETKELMQVQGPVAPSVMNAEMLSQLRRVYQLRPVLIAGFGGIALLMIAIMIYLTRSSRKAMAGLVGKTLLFAGLGGLLTAFVMQYSLPQLSSADTGAARVMASVASDVAKDLISVIMQTVLAYSAAFAVVGAALWAYAWTYKDKGTKM